MTTYAYTVVGKRFLLLFPHYTFLGATFNPGIIVVFCTYFGFLSVFNRNPGRPRTETMAVGGGGSWGRRRCQYVQTGNLHTRESQVRTPSLAHYDCRRVACVREFTTRSRKTLPKRSRAAAATAALYVFRSRAQHYLL